MPNKSLFVTPELLETIFSTHKAAWTEKYITVPKRTAAVILVLDPSFPVETSSEPITLWQGILGEQEATNWRADRPYHEFAFAKARAAWRTKMSNHHMLKNPESIQVGDFKYPGGIYTEAGLVIATSGLATGMDDVELSGEFANLIRLEVNLLTLGAINDTASFYF